jgi:hypothetical protein
MKSLLEILKPLLLTKKSTKATLAEHLMLRIDIIYYRTFAILDESQSFSGGKSNHPHNIAYIISLSGIAMDISADIQ